MSMDPDIDPDVVAVIGASAALSLSGRAVQRPGRRRARRLPEQQYLLNPGNKALRTRSSTSWSPAPKAVLMVESGPEAVRK